MKPRPVFVAAVVAASVVLTSPATFGATRPAKKAKVTKTTKAKTTPATAAPTTAAPVTAAPTTATPATSAAPTTAPSPAGDATPGVGRNLARTWDPNATVTYGLTTLPGQLDPHKPVAAEAIEFRVLGLIYDRLLTIKADGTLAGMLATKWGYTADGRGLDITIRSDVKFHDGSPLDANAVKANIERAKASGSGLVAPRLADVLGVDVIAPYTVRLRLAKPTTDIPYVLAAYSSGMIINPKSFNDPDQLLKNPAGSGPYVLGRFIPGDSASLIRAPGKYWDPDAGRVARIDIIVYTDATAQTNAIRAGQIDTVNIRENQRTFEPDVRAGRLKQTIFEPDNRVVLYFNRNIRPFDDIRVRQAINYAVNRDALASLSVGSVASWQEFRKGLPGFDPALENKYPYNVARAKQLLADAGFPNGFRVAQPILSTLAISADIAVAVQAQLAAVGISVDIQPTNAQQIFAIYAEGRHAMQLNFGNSNANPSAALSGHWEIPARNPAGVTPEYRNLFAKGDNNQLPFAEQEKAFKEVNKYLTEQSWHAPLFWNSFYWFSNPKLQDLDKMDYSGNSLSDFRYVSIAK